MLRVFNTGLEGTMPFVTVLASAQATRVDDIKNKVERACKKVWVSMGEGFDEKDVGGVLVRNAGRIVKETNSMKVFFQYVDRGGTFYVELHRKLSDELNLLARSSGCKEPEVIPLPTSAEHWFEDPNWSRG